MFGRKSELEPDQPFWVDDPTPYSPPRPRQHNFLARFSVALFAVSNLVRFALLIAFIVIALKFPWAWLFVLLQGGLLLARAYFPQSLEAKLARAAQIQQRAKTKTGAAHIGSALHTAGHPLLQTNQPVVLALTETELSFYSYTKPIPIDTIRVNDLQSIETVVYDDDRVPHLGVIDNMAQALQLTFPWRGGTCTCLFRRMYNIRPIEWHQAIQTARLVNGAG
ncbi:MAG: hypothetical protein ACT4QE_20875 [Anaerolineales bacterium]